MARLSITKTCQRLLEHDDILFLCHHYPDGDTIGSAFALCRAMLDMGKRASVQCGDILPEKFSYIFSDIEPAELSKRPYIVAVDVADPKLLGILEKEYEGRIDLCIDHHSSNKFYAKETCLDAEASAAGEVVYRIMNGLGAKLTQPIALAIYTAICTDTGCFKYSNVTARTHRIAAKLIETGIDFYSVNQKMFDTKSRARMSIERMMTESLDFRRGGSVAFMTLSEDMIRGTGASEGDIDGISSIARTIEGVEIGVTMRQTGGDTYKVSIRTIPGIDAGEIAGRMGGGGHPAAAGCIINAPLPEAKDAVMESINRTLGETV